MPRSAGAAPLRSSHGDCFVSVVFSRERPLTGNVRALAKFRAAAAGSAAPVTLP